MEDDRKSAILKLPAVELPMYDGPKRAQQEHTKRSHGRHSSWCTIPIRRVFGLSQMPKTWAQPPPEGFPNDRAQRFHTNPWATRPGY
jgi:hypothetical protein